ncbi:MAG TPA: hypothetical protein VMM84_11720 [Pyrinomonadaceae bacterium]|nr:hypothetical protein [Pyrinomonadaceae bacterium]
MNSRLRLQHHPSLVLPGICLLILFIATSVIGQSKETTVWDNGITERWWLYLDDFSQADLERAIERWELIKKETEAAASPGWAGGYSNGGDTHGSYMRWSPRMGFVMAHVNKCEARLVGLTFGSAKTSGGLAEFIVEYHNSVQSHGHGRTHKSEPSHMRFIPIKWSTSQFLVEERQMPRFGDYVAGLGEYNQEFMWEWIEFFVRGSREPNTDYDNPPQVPPGYDRFIKMPINGEIIAVGAPRLGRFRDGIGQLHKVMRTPVSLNVGRLNGVKRGMFFHVVSPDVYERVKVLRVERRTSRGVVERGVDENEQEHPQDPQISVGWKLSTRPYHR